MKIPFSVILLFFALPLLSLENPPVAVGRASCTFTEMKLENGMKVWFMPTHYEADEVLIKVAALGGYASLSSSERYSGEMAALIAWESGLGEMSTDQLSAFLYEHSLDLSIKIHPFSRLVEGSSSKEELFAFLNCIHFLFTKQNFSQEGWKNAQSVAQNSLDKLSQDYDYLYETELIKVNTQNVDFLKPMTPADLTKVDFSFAKKFFLHSFSNPAEFVCVIVGSFDLDAVKQSVSASLGKIPAGTLRFDYTRELVAPFPAGISEKAIKVKGRSDSITRLTFPLKIAVNETNMHVIAFATQIIEARLRKVITERMKQSHGIDVSYEFPLYPKLDNAWISVRFRSEGKEIPFLKQQILEQLNLLISKGPSDVEMEHIRKLELGNDEFWMKDNSYWASTLMNYSLWRWAPEAICSDALKAQNLNPKDIHSFLSKAITLLNYSVVIGHP